LLAPPAFPAAEPIYFHIRLDYALFASLILTTAAALADLKAYSRQPIASTLLARARTTTALIQAKPLYTNKHYSLLEATLTDTPSQKC
jgi:hypothetical protein